MRKFSAGVIVAGALSLTAAPVALSTPAADSPAPVGGPSAHTHHIHTGNGECVDIDSVRFEHTDHGLHQGAAQSGPAHGPWHGTCANHRAHPSP